MSQNITSYSVQPKIDFSFLDEKETQQPIEEQTSNPVASPAETAAQNLNYTGRYSQQQIIEARQNAQRLGAPFEDTLQHSAVAAQQAGAVTPQDLQGFSPEFVAALANNGKTVFAAREDLPALNMLAKVLDQSEWPYQQPHPDDPAPIIPVSPDGRPQMWETRYSGTQRTGIRLAEGLDQISDSMRGLLMGATEGWAAGIRKDIASNPRLADVEDNSKILDYIENIGANVRKGLESARQTRPALLPEAQDAATRYFENVVMLAPQIGVQVASAFVNPAVGMALMGAQIGGGTYVNLTDQGIDPDTALTASIGNALAQAPLERLGLEKAMAVWKTSGVWNTIKAIGGSAIIEGITEWMQAYPEAVAEIWAQTTQQGGDFEQGYKTFVNRLGEITLQGMYEGALALPYGGLFGGMGMIKHGRQQAAPQLAPELQQFFTQELAQAQAYAQRQALTDALSTAAQNIDGMATMRQGPQAVAEMLDEVIPPALQQTWIGADDAVTLYQEAQERGEAEAAAVLDTLGTDADGLQQAAEQGAPLPVSTAKLLTHTSGDTRASAMAALRATADGVSGTEAANYNPADRAREAMQRVLNEASESPATGTAAALAEARSAQKIRADVDREITRITHEIEAAGFPRHVAQTNAALHQQRVLAMRAAYGDPAVDSLKRISFAKVLPGQAQHQQDALFHAMYAAKDTDMATFFSRVQAEGPQGKKSYFAFSVPGELEGVPFRIPSDTALHQAKRHSDVTPQDNAALPHIFQSLTAENTALSDKQGIYGQQYIGTAEINGVNYGVGFEVNKKGEVYVTTLFKDTPKRLQDWLNKEQKRASIVPEASSTERHQKPGVDYGKPSSAKTLRQMLADVNSAPELFQPAYHGSPYRFDKFTLDHIGTGEGNQAYGWGLYFAGDKNVAEYYRNSVRADSFLVDGNLVEDPPSHEAHAYQAASSGTLDKHIAMLKNEVDRHAISKNRRAVESAQENLEFAQSLKDKNVSHREGQLYEADIPEDHELLDLEKTLAEQPEQVKEAIASIAGHLPENAVEDLGGDVSLLLDPESTGADFYGSLRALVGGPEAASRLLNSIGIKGNRYLDGSSRFAGEGSYNYVIFDDNAIEVLQTYYQQEQAGPLGSVSLSPQSAAVSIFDGANLSTIPHESAHIFLDDLTRIAADDGSLALAELQRAVAVTLKGEMAETAQQVNTLLAQVQKAAPQDRLTALHTLAADLHAQTQETRTESKRLDEEATTLQQQDQEQGIEDTGQITQWKQSRTQQYQADARAAALSRIERSVRQSIKHLHGLDQARADVQTLRQWAEVPLDGDLVRGSEDYTKFHEAVARGFEQYLMEGKAPSKKLDGVFGRLRAWLLEVYKNARDVLGLPISDDVRRVFDRMLATDQQMKQSRQLQNTLAAERDFAAKHAESFEEWEELSEMLSQAEREVQATADRATLRNRNKRFKEYYADALESLNASPFWQMVESVSARTRTPDGISTGGLTRESVAHFIGAERAAELSKARPGIINAQGGGIHADIAAMEHGFDDADTMLNDLYDALVMRRESKKTLATSLAEQQLQADDSLNEAELMSMSAESYAAYLDKVDETTLRIAAKKGYRTVEEQDRFVRNSITPRNRIQAMAADSLRHTPLRDITPERYQAMLDKALRDRSKALIDGDVMGAIRAVENARLANELMWGSRAQLARRDALLKLAAETAAAKPGTFPTVHREAMRKLLDQYGLAHMRGLPEEEYRNSALRDLVNQTMQEDVVEVLPSFANWLLDGTTPNSGNALPGGRQSWRDLTPSQLYDVENLLAYLRKTGYNARTDAKNSEAAKVELLATQAGRNMLTLPEMPTAPADSLRGKAQESARGLYATIDSVRWELRKADAFVNLMGDGQAGPMEDALLNKILTGEQRARDRIEHINTLMAPHLVHLAQSVKQWEAQHGKNLMLKDAQGNLVQLPASMQKAYSRKTWTSDMVIALALNTGNASNMARITSGYPDMTYEMLAPLLGDQVAARIMSSKFDINFRPQGNKPGLLSLRDWQAIQGIWDALGTQWADTQATHDRMFGFKPQGVEHLPLTITDPATGQAVALPGGYYPVRYDPKVSDRVAQWGEQEDILNRNESMFAIPSAKRSHTQARAEKAAGHPLRFDTGIIMEHINDAVRFIELGEITRQADKVTQHPAFRSAYTAAFGRKDYDAIRPNLRGLVRQEPAPRSDWVVSTANMMRKYLVPWGLAWNLKVAALQFTAVYPAMGDIGAQHVLRGMAHMTRHGMGALRQIWDVSPYMKSRMNNIDQDLQRNIANFNPSKRPSSVSIGGKEFSWEDMVNAGMLPIVAVDAAATAAVWTGAYNKKLAQLQGSATKYGVDTDSQFHQQAVDFADSMVKQSNPDFDPSSRSGFLRAQNAYRLVNNFSSAVTLFAARHKYMYTARSKGKVSLARLARFELYDTILPAVSMFMFLALVRGYFGSDKDDKKDMAELLTASMVDFGGMRVPIFGQAAGDGLMGLMGFNEGGLRTSGLRTALDMPFQLSQAVTNRTGRAMWQGVKNADQAKNLIYGAADIASFIARVPVSKLVRAGERGLDQWQRGQGTPLSILIPRPGK